MDVSLDQAIEIHARVLKRWHRDRAPREAHTRALECKTAGDVEGHHVWTRVAKTCEALGAVETARGLSPAEDRSIQSSQTHDARACSGDEQIGSSGSTGATP
jgi:hypothetical protein